MSMKKTQIVGVVLLVAIALQYVSVPFIDGRSIALFATLLSAIYLLIAK